MTRKWPRLLCSKAAPDGVLCTSDVHRAMLGPTWVEMPTSLNEAFIAPAVAALGVVVEELQSEAAPATVTPAGNDVRKPRKRGHA